MKVAIAKIRIAVESGTIKYLKAFRVISSGTIKYLKAFRVISSEMPISLLILS